MKATRMAGSPRQTINFIIARSFPHKEGRGRKPDEGKQGGQGERKRRLSEAVNNIQPKPDHQRDKEDHDYRAEQGGTDRWISGSCNCQSWSLISAGCIDCDYLRSGRVN
jgi:hypothetical protein